jgi:hypothetical protein
MRFPKSEQKWKTFKNWQTHPKWMRFPKSEQKWKTFKNWQTHPKWMRFPKSEQKWKTFKKCETGPKSNRNSKNEQKQRWPESRSIQNSGRSLIYKNNSYFKYTTEEFMPYLLTF